MKIRHPVTLFCTANLLLVVLIAVIFSLDYVPFQLAPAILALLITGVSKGRSGICSLCKKVKYERTCAKWYLFALFAPFVFCAISYAIFSLAEYGSLSFPSFDRPLSSFALECFIITMGSYGEEIGWRGYLLPELRQKHSFFSSTLIVGIIWDIWHLRIGFGLPVFVVYLTMVIELSLIFSWLSQKTENNILSVIILHGSFNLCTLLFYSHIFMSDSPKNNLMLLIYGSMAIILILPCLFIMKGMLFPKAR